MLILSPGKTPASPNEIDCFSDVWSYYLIGELNKIVNLTTIKIPAFKDAKLVEWFEGLDVARYDAVIALGLRYFSTIPEKIGRDLKKRVYPGFLCQIHDGSRLDNDPVDITFTLKNESEKYPPNAEANRYVRHHSYNSYLGWAADADLNTPRQDAHTLRILVDHTNYGSNPIDLTKEILRDIQGFIDSKIWTPRWKGISVRRFDSGRVVDVDFDQIDEIQRYNRTGIPFVQICQEHSEAHIFCVTHPESVGQVVLETAVAGALTLTPVGFIPRDRLDTVRAIEYNGKIDWQAALDNIDPQASRLKSVSNSWAAVAKKLRDTILIRKYIRRSGDSND